MLLQRAVAVAVIAVLRPVVWVFDRWDRRLY